MTKPTTIIVFAPGLGGNHVANLVSLAPGMQPQFVPQGQTPYSYQLLNKYRDFALQVHFDRFNTGDPVPLHLYKEEVLDNPDQLVICCHIRRLYELLNNSYPSFVDYIKPKQIIIIRREETNEFAHDRWDWKMTQLRDLWSAREVTKNQTPEDQYKSYMATQGGPRFDPYNKATYTRDNVLKVINLASYKLSDDAKIVEWSADEIFTDGGDEYIATRALEDFGWTISTMSKPIHRLWITELRKLVDTFKNQPRRDHRTS